MLRTLVIYSGKYGTTRDVARTIALITGPARYCSVDEFKPEYKEFEFIVIGSPVYQEKLDPSIIEFVKNNQDWLNEKPVAVFCTCLDKNGGLYQLTELQSLVEKEFLSLKPIGGRLIIENLDETDLELIKKFLDMVKLPFQDMDFYNQEEVINYAMKLKSQKEILIKQLGEDELIKSIEEFLKSHNTCTLATCHSERVRSTPIEYTYSKGNVYLISEGGEKFANLLLNDEVSISVYEDYTNMNDLKGMQISGKAAILDASSEEYDNALDLKGIKADLIDSLPVSLNMIGIKIEKIEFLNSKFVAEGADAKQIYVFK